MKKRILTSLATIALASTLVGGATFALFTDSAENQNNTFSTGTLDIVLNNDPDDVITSFNVTNMVPGAHDAKVVNVKNAGTLPLTYSLALTKTGALFGGATPLAITIKDSTGAVIDPATASRTLPVGADENLTVEYNFPDADNSYQGATGSFDLVFDAHQ